jgi:tripartite-type tricarboxylate transporter receptor subunit TctC
MRIARILSLAAAVSISLAASAGVAQAAPEDFFRGKTIRLVVGTPPGGGYDAYARLVARHIVDYLPGHPTVIVTNMPGASGMNATHWVYALAPRDGTVFATFNKSEPFYQAIGQKGASFKTEELSWIGSLSQAADTVNVLASSGVRSIEDIKQKELVVGADSGGTMTLFPALLNATIGTKFKIVTGYEGSAAVYHAIELGEVQGVGSTPWVTWKTMRPDWVRDGKILALVQVGLKPEADLPGVPRLIDLAQNDEQRRMFTFVSAVAAIERPYAAPPGIPADLLAAYRQAFDEMTRDKTFLAEAEKQNMDIDPQTGAEVEAIVRDIVTTPAAIVAKVRAVADEGR